MALVICVKIVVVNLSPVLFYIKLGHAKDVLTNEEELRTHTLRL